MTGVNLTLVTFLTLTLDGRTHVWLVTDLADDQIYPAVWLKVSKLYLLLNVFDFDFSSLKLEDQDNFVWTTYYVLTI